MSKTLDCRLEKLEKAELPGGALICSTDEPDRFKWVGHEGTYTLADIERRIDPGGVILIWDTHVPKPPGTGDVLQA